MKTAAIGSAVAEVRRWDPSKEASGPITYVDLSSVDQSRKKITEPSTIAGSEAPSRARQLISAGDVLVSTVRPNLNAVAYVPPALDGATASTGFCVLRPKPGEIDGRYLFHWVRTGAFVGRMVQLATGASYPAVSDKIVKASAVPLSPIEEQRRIAAVLDAADALRAKRRQALAKLDSLTQAIFIDMFGDPVANPMEFPGETLKSAFNFTTGKLDANAAVEGGKYPYFTCARETSAIDEYAFDCEALLLAGGNNANADYSVKHHRGRFNAYQRTYVITVDESRLTYEYARLALENLLGDLKRFSKGTNTKYLTMRILNRMPVLVPPIDLQRRFASSVDFIERQRTSQRGHLRTLDTLFASLQQRAFRGDL